MDELIEVKNCAESYLENAKYHLLHGGYEKALSFANMARDEINYIIKHASQQSAHADAGDSAASSGIVHASAESTSQTEPTPTQRG